MKKIAEGNSPHIVSLVGCITSQEPLCLITEFLVFGNLLSYLHTVRDLLQERLRRRGSGRGLGRGGQGYSAESDDSGYPVSVSLDHV